MCLSAQQIGFFVSLIWWTEPGFEIGRRSFLFFLLKVWQIPLFSAEDFRKERRVRVSVCERVWWASLVGKCSGVRCGRLALCWHCTAALSLVSLQTNSAQISYENIQIVKSYSQSTKRKFLHLCPFAILRKKFWREFGFDRIWKWEKERVREKMTTEILKEKNDQNENEKVKEGIFWKIHPDESTRTREWLSTPSFRSGGN